MYLKMWKAFKKFTDGNARKSTVNFALSGYADVIKYKEKPTFSYERAQINEARNISARAVIKLWGATLSSDSDVNEDVTKASRLFGLDHFHSLFTC